LSVLSQDWIEQNQKFLVASINQIKGLLKEYIAGFSDKSTISFEQIPFPEENMVHPPAIQAICNLFNLTPFERSVLLLCAGVELDGEVAQLCSNAQRNPRWSYPTFGLALAAFPNADWSALLPKSPLRRFRLVSFCSDSSIPIASRPLHIEERVLHYLTGISYLEKSLQLILRQVRDVVSLADSQKLLIDRILLVWKSAKEELSQIQLLGDEEEVKVAVAKQACAKIGLGLWFMPSELMPSKSDDWERFVELWSREPALLGAGLYVSAEDVEYLMQKHILRYLEFIPGPIFVGLKRRVSIYGRSEVSIEVKKPEKTEQVKMWKCCLGDMVDNLSYPVSRLANQFTFGHSSILNICTEALDEMKNGADLSEALWKTSRRISRQRVPNFAQHHDSTVELNDLVLPEHEKKILNEIAIRIEQRHKVFDEWGFKTGTQRGLGITALFSGPSGTGKTLAAEALANKLQLDLFHIDLSAVVSKYIGETEKALRQLFDAAEEGGGILFFDEADALFGRRSEVKDSHDRYANIEINYLLQRMENCKSLAVLAIERQSTLDPAFIRRIQFVVNFPFPDEEARVEMWRRIFPKNTPVESLDINRLAKLKITGGQIRNIALDASFSAANAGVSVNMMHVRKAVQAAYEKLGYVSTQAEDLEMLNSKT
jgi:AAA+ superfamily predicted ATPase